MKMILQLVLILLLILLFYRHLPNCSSSEHMMGFGRSFPDSVGDERVFPNRFDAAPYGPYPWADPQYS